MAAYTMHRPEPRTARPGVRLLHCNNFSPELYMKTRLVQIGNSRGIRLAKPVIEQAGLEDEVEIRVEGGSIIITPVSARRAGWAESIAKHGPAPLLDAPTPTRFDEEEWSW